eukprot:m.96522 g.96522  ORF g.96522 m.96522 type:complete len:99 (+) comp8967_c0_seq15:611-907(+)
MFQISYKNKRSRAITATLETIGVGNAQKEKGVGRAEGVFVAKNSFHARAQQTQGIASKGSRKDRYYKRVIFAMSLFSFFVMVCVSNSLIDSPKQKQLT